MDKEPVRGENAGEGPEKLLERARRLHSAAVDWEVAWEATFLEERIKGRPAAWGDNLQILIYGDFHPPNEVFHFEPLGITVHPENLKDKGKVASRSVLSTLKADVRLAEKTVTAVIDAARRVNTLLGAWVLVQWGNAAYGWWSCVRHGTMAGGMGTFDHAELEQAIGKIVELRSDVRRKLASAFYWIREPRQLLVESYRSDVLRIFAGYWNAFECLVDAIALLDPPERLTALKKQQLIDSFVAQRNGKLTPGDVEKAYRTIVNPGFRGQASHALRVCFRQRAEQYIAERFERREDSLYAIRNAINHGDIDAENPQELIRVGTKLTRLWLIVWGMFGRIVPFSAPMEPRQADAS